MNKLKLFIKNSIRAGAVRVILTSLIAALACTGIIQAATTIGSNITTGGTLNVTGASTLTGNTAITGTLGVTGASTFTTASSTGTVKFATINSDTGAISFGDENLTTTGNINLATASSTGIVKFSQINSDTGSINFGDDNIYTTGNIGVGTSSPYAKLSVVGEAVASYFTATSTTATSTFAGDFTITAPHDNTTFKIKRDAIDETQGDIARNVAEFMMPVAIDTTTSTGGYGTMGAFEIWGRLPSTINYNTLFSNSMWSGALITATSGSWDTSTNGYFQLGLRGTDSGTVTYTTGITNMIGVTNFASETDYVIPTLKGIQHNWSETQPTRTGTYTIDNMYSLFLDGYFAEIKTINVSNLWSDIYIGDSDGINASPAGTQVTKSGIWMEEQVIGDTNNYGIVLDGNDSGGSIVFGIDQDVSIYHSSTTDALVLDATNGGNVAIEGGALTIASTSAAVTVTGEGNVTLALENRRSYVRINRAAGAVNVDYIGGGVDGQLLILKADDDAITMTICDTDDVCDSGDGNIQLDGGVNFDLDDSLDRITLMYDSADSVWVELSRSNNN